LKSLSFRAQGYISLGLLMVFFLFAQVFRMGVFHNAGWILAGLLFVINPVWPNAWDWREHDKLKKGIRIVSVLVIVIFGCLMRYGV